MHLLFTVQNAPDMYSYFPQTPIPIFGKSNNNLNWSSLLTLYLQFKTEYDQAVHFFYSIMLYK